MLLGQNANTVRLQIAIAALGLVLAGADRCMAGKFNAKLSIGDAAPTWQALPGSDGKQHASADQQGAKATVVIFTCNHCPCALGYDERLIQVVKDYSPRGVTVVAINCGSTRVDGMAAIQDRAKKKGLNFVTLADRSQKSGQAFGATCTPHCFVLDANRKVVYMGAIDDHNKADQATRHYLRDALDAVLAGKSPEVKETRQRGCMILYEDEE